MMAAPPSPRWGPAGTWAYLAQLRPPWCAPRCAPWSSHFTVEEAYVTVESLCDATVFASKWQS